jgi:hypothetical protein
MKEPRDDMTDIIIAVMMAVSASFVLWLSLR